MIASTLRGLRSADVVPVLRSWRSFEPQAGKPFDDAVGEPQERLRDGKADRFCGLQIDFQIEFRGLFDWQAGHAGNAPISGARAFIRDVVRLPMTNHGALMGGTCQASRLRQPRAAG